MAYQHSQLARECSAVRTPSARLVLMILASAMDKDKHTCYWRWKTLLHYSKLSRSTLAAALKEIEACGIVTRQHRYRQSNIYVWHTDVAEGLRDPVKQESEERSQEAKSEASAWDTDSSEVTPDDRAMFLGGLRTMFVPKMDGTKPYEDEWLEFVSDKDEREAMNILNWMLAENRDQRLQEHFPSMGTAARVRRFKGISSLKAAWPRIVKAFSQTQAVRDAFHAEEELY
jgi:DNA-binding MarR family transcriptional regulator